MRAYNLSKLHSNSLGFRETDRTRDGREEQREKRLLFLFSLKTFFNSTSTLTPICDNPTHIWLDNVNYRDTIYLVIIQLSSVQMYLAAEALCILSGQASPYLISVFI